MLSAECHPNEHVSASPQRAYDTSWSRRLVVSPSGQQVKDLQSRQGTCPCGDLAARVVNGSL